MEALISALPQAAVSPFAFVAYVILVIGFIYSTVTQQRLKRITNVIKDLPEDQRAALLTREYPEYPSRGISSEQYIRLKKHRSILIIILAIIMVILILSTISLVIYQGDLKEQRTTERVERQTSVTDWNMSLQLAAAVISKDMTSENTATILECDYLSGKRYSPVSYKKGEPLRLTAKLKLTVDNVFEKNRNMIYPIGLSTTWDDTIHTLYDGVDAEQDRLAHGGGTLNNEIIRHIQLKPSEISGRQYIVILSGATMNSQQLFHASVEGQESANDILKLNYSNFENKECSGFIEHPFVHPDGRLEKVLWPIIAIPIDFA